MNWEPLFSAIDSRPFRPFVLSLTGGEQIAVTHPDNLFVLPTRQKVNHIEVYETGTDKFTIIYPEALAALHMGGQRASLT
ncbi:MAG: hypothetical protein HYY16_17750 [Planctomycetes bacterium]|nr:hypothetical protein [Planctomycetota bacterium]